MRHSILFFSLLIVSLSMWFMVPVRHHDTDYPSEWLKIDSLEKLGLYRQALGKVVEVYGDAKQDHKSGEELKALIYKLRFIHVLSEDGYPEIIKELENERIDDRIALKAVKTSMLAEIYSRYYQNIRWLIFKNSTQDSPDLIHPETWSPAQFGEYISNLFQESLEQPNILATVCLEKYQTILKDSLPLSNELSLLDLLSSRALDFYEKSELDYSPDPLPEFLLDTMLFAQRLDFLDWLEVNNEGNSFSSRSLEIFGGMIRHHLDDASESELLASDLKRLSYAYRIFLPEEGDQWYLDALDVLAGICLTDSLRAGIYYEKAQFYSVRSGKYKINGRDTAKYNNDKRLAFFWAQQAMELGPESRAATKSQNLINRIVAPFLHVGTEVIVIPNRDIPASLEYANLDEVWYWITPVSPDKTINPGYRPGRTAGDIFIEGNSPVAFGRFSVPDRKDYNLHRATVNLPPLLEGSYQLIFSNSSDPDNRDEFISEGYLRVSELSWLTQKQDDGNLLIHIVDRGSGNPVAGISVKQYFRHYDNRSRAEELKPGREFISDRMGCIIISPKKSTGNSYRSESFHLLFGSLDHGLFSPERFYLYPNQAGRVPRPSQRIFTDRSIYRPGQTVQFTGLLVIEDQNKLLLDKPRNFEVYFQDSKYKSLDTLQLITDDFGFFSGSFNIPSDALGGRFHIITSWGRQSLRVEQYKRPGFQIIIDTDTRVYIPGDSIYINGKAEAFAGMPLKGASVDIEAYLELQSFHPLKHRFTGRKIRVGATKDKLNDQGKFNWAVESVSLLGSTLSTASYEFRVKIKDINGETRELSHRVILSKSPLTSRVSGPSKIDRRNGGSWKVFAISPGMRKVQAPLLVRIALLNSADIRLLPYPLRKPDTWIMTQKQWEKRFPRVPYRISSEQDSISKVVFSGIYNVDIEGINLNPVLSGWDKGRYRIIVSRPETQEDIIGQFEFDLFDSKRKIFPARDPIWLTSEQRKYQPGQTMEYFMGARYPGLYLLEISGKDTIFQRDWVSLGNRLSKRELFISDQMLGNISIQLHGVYENNHFARKILVKVPWENKKLEIIGLDSLAMVEPGDSADLSFKVRDNAGNPVSMQGVLTIYDSSLDEIYPHSWVGFKWPVVNTVKTWKSGGFGIAGSRIRQSPKIPFVKLDPLPEVSLEWFGLGYYSMQRGNRSEMVMQSEAQPMKMGAANEGSNESDAVFFLKEELSDITQIDVSGVNQSEQVPSPYFRKDLRETAYFISNFKTDEKGEGSVHFIVPEAITKWKVILYGHDGEMAQALTESDFQSKKSLMLLPNFPRFVRIGDQLQLSVKLTYEGTDSSQARARLQIENTQDPAITLLDLSQEISLSPSDQQVLYWNFEVPENQHYLRLNLSCTAGKLSDGITADIPVLPRELSFWETKNFMLRDPSEIIISTGKEAERAVLELNTQPMWLAVQSMPTFTSKGLPCSELWFTRYFTSRLIHKISHENPDIRNRMMTMANEMETDPRLNTFLRNNEMRRFVLESGLWEGAAEEEAIHIMALAESFIPENNSREIENSFNQLVKLQLSDGSWPWFRGMRPDFRMTLHILGGLGELAAMDSDKQNMNTAMDQMLSRAVQAVDRTVYERYNRQKLANPKQEPGLSGDIIYYLYVRSFFLKNNISEKHLEAYSYYFEKAGKDWLKWSISQQVFIAMAYLRNSEEDIPNLVMNSLLDRRLDSDAGGIYWKMGSQNRGWYGRDIWQQSRVIEFFNSMPLGNEYLDAMKTWLIQQKRSRDWGDRISTAMAVKSLILYGSNWYTSKPVIRIQSGSEYFSPVRIDLGTDLSGHYRYTWDESELGGGGLDLQISKRDKLPVWGSLYINKTMDLDTLEAAGSDLVIKRIIMVETSINGQLRWIPINEKEIMSGQRIRIRLEIDARQAVDYVQLRDYRPAAFEPDKSLSGYRWGHGLSWYQTHTDQFTDFFIPHLPKGFTFFEYGLYAEQSGDFSGGYAEIQSQYAPEFMARSKGGRISVK